MVPLTVVEVLVPARNVILPPMAGTTVLFTLPVDQPKTCKQKKIGLKAHTAAA